MLASFCVVLCLQFSFIGYALGTFTLQAIAVTPLAMG